MIVHNPSVNPVAQVAALVAALIHVLIFGMESVLFARPSVRRTFGVADADMAAVQPWAFNQGFYNLFLAIGCLAGLIVVNAGSHAAGRALVVLSCGSMVAAAVVLLATNRRMLRLAAIQGLAPLVAVALAFV